MTLHTPLCDLLGVEHPIMLAGMGGVSYAEVVAAVTNAGGYGTLGMAGRGPDFIREQMRAVRKLTDGPFGVDLLAASPESLTAAVEIIIEEGASSFIAGLGVPMRRWGEPEDFGGMAVYLASDASRFHTGDTFMIDGGYAIF